MVYLTYNDAPDGIYQSQVIDTCRFWEETFNEKVTLVALISGRGFFLNRKKIKQSYSHSLVLPMYPKITNWERNLSVLRTAMLFRKRGNVIARGVFATLLARDSRKFSKVCFDARGAYTAEWTEYLKTESPLLAETMSKLESRAVLQSDSRIAVSQKLINYWKESFHYSFLKHAVIPCTLNSDVKIVYDAAKISSVRQQLGITDNEVVLVYSGSSAGWQSFTVLDAAISNAFTQNPSLKLLMLSKPGAEKTLAGKFPGRIIQKWVNESEVQNYLQAADYGLLVREKSTTNEVSSPVKFAEYLAAGLPVIISEHIGDYSSFVSEKNCGMTANNVDWILLKRPSGEEKQRIQSIAELYFRKKAYIEQYKKLF
ncbi:MAG: hypothetical protein ACLQQ4_13840 [Bacteroidia bacterium]